MSSPRSEERTRGVTVKVIDMQPLYDEWSTEVHARNPEITKVAAAYEWAIGRDPKGGFHLICSEGVSWAMPPEDAGKLRPAGYPEPVDVDLYDRSNPNKIAMLPIATVKVTAEDLRDLPAEDKDLADFVREFGRRLEQNFWVTHAILTGKSD